MNLANVMPKGRARGGNGAGSKKVLELLVHAGGKKALACGVTWRTIATSGGRADAIKLARSAGATHYIFRGQQLGMGTMPAGTEATMRVFPAALVAARTLVGTAVSALRVGDDEYWVAVTKDGATTSSDFFLSAADDAAALDKVRELQEQFGGAESVQVYTNIEQHGIDGARSLAAEDLLDYSLAESEALQPLPRAGLSIPKPLAYVMLVVLASVLGQKGWEMYDSQRRARLAAMNQVAEVDPVQAWTQAITSWESTNAGPAVDSLTAARLSLSQVPLEWDGYVMNQADCSAGAINVGAQPASRSWACRAQYTRTRSASLNRDMARRKLPDGWTVTFTPLNGMQLTWSVQQPAQPVSVAQLPKPSHYAVEMASRMQRVLPALSGDVPLQFAAVEIPAPKKSDGTVMPPDPRAEGLSMATLAVKAPLRSIDALIAAEIYADWHQITLVYDAQGLKGGINNSALMAEANGKMYAKQ